MYGYAPPPHLLPDDDEAGKQNGIGCFSVATLALCLVGVVFWALVFWALFA